MAEKSQLQLITEEGVKAWNKWREENPKIQVDLREASLIDANLSKANLSKASLRYANLHSANLSQANLSEASLNEANLYLANLSQANLSEANLGSADLTFADLNQANLRRASLFGAKLIRAELIESDLRGANLRGADLTLTTLSISDISGANITGTNQHQWNIKGIKCTHVIWNDKTINYDNPDDFEKTFTQVENVVEMLLNLPFSELSHLTGRITQQAINQKYGEGSLLFKGQTAISNDKTKYEFISFSTPGKVTEINNKLLELQNQLKPVIEEAKSRSENQSPLGFKSEIDIPLTKGALVVRPKELKRVLEERYTEMHPLLQNIVHTIQLHIR